MPDDDWGTVNIKPKKATAREVGTLRKRYEEQRDILGQLAADAPSDHLAREYMRVRADVETGLSRLDALESTDATLYARPTTPSPDRATVAQRPQPEWSAPAMTGSDPVESEYGVEAGTQYVDKTRLVMIPLIGIVLLAALGFFVWRSMSSRGEDNSRIVEQRNRDVPVTEATESTAPVPVAASPAGPLTIQPDSQDFGTIRKGTRATRQYDLTNVGNTELVLKVARSACRCMYYEYVDKLPAKGNSNLTVTIDGGKAKKGELRETVEIKAKTGDTSYGSIEVIALIE